MTVWVGQRLRVLSLAGGVAAGVILALWTPPDDPAQSVCIWRRTTGVPCPGCGMLRAASHLARGGWETAIAYHPLVVPVVAQAVMAWAWWTLASDGRVRPARAGTVTAWLLANLVLLVAVWVVRALTGTLPP